MSDPQLIDRLKALWTVTVRRGDFSIEVIDVVQRGEQIYATARTIAWRDDVVQDVREQDVFFGAPEDYDKDDRNVAMVEAWMDVVAEVFSSMTHEAFSALMPAELVFGDLGALGNCETRPQFDKALRTKKRLGAYLST